MAVRRREFVIATHEVVVPDEGGAVKLYPKGRPDLNIVAGQIVRGRRILDIGCQTGLDVWYLAAHNQVVGLDLASKPLRWAHQHDIQVLIGDAESSLPFGDEQFDMVIVKDVFEHMLDPTMLLYEAHRVLSSGGTLIANVPNHFFFWGRLRMLLGKGCIWKTLFGDHTQFYDEWNYQHIRFFTWTGFQKFLGQPNFARIEFVWEFGELLYHPKQAILTRLNCNEFRWRTLSPLLKPLVHVFFTIFPRPLRVTIARWRPGLFSACFYARCTKQ